MFKYYQIMFKVQMNEFITITQELIRAQIVVKKQGKKSGWSFLYYITCSLILYF